MPKLSPLQWLVAVLFLGFYGYAVFAVTRDYYVRNPPRTTAVPAAPHALPAAQTSGRIDALLQPGAAAPAVLPTGTDPSDLARAADALFVQKRYAEAVPYYRRVLELAPGDPDASNDLGLALHYLGRSREATDVLSAGTEHSPGFQRLWLTLGFVSARAGDAEAARTALERAQELGPDNSVGREAVRLLGLLDAQ